MATEDLWLVSLNTNSAAAFVDLYIPNVTGPVLQEPPDDPVRNALGARVYELWLVDRRGRLRFRHSSSQTAQNETLYRTQIQELLDD